jgi:hypothetical protein
MKSKQTKKRAFKKQSPNQQYSVPLAIGKDQYRKCLLSLHIRQTNKQKKEQDARPNMTPPSSEIAKEAIQSPGETCPKMEWSQDSLRAMW